MSTLFTLSRSHLLLLYDGNISPFNLLYIFSHFEHISYISNRFTTDLRGKLEVNLFCHELQHTRPPYLSPTPGVHPNPCPLSR